MALDDVLNYGSWVPVLDCGNFNPLSEIAWPQLYSIPDVESVVLGSQKET